jgi:hypothetical protein
MPVSIDPTLPLEVTVDFQSKHRAAFRLFTKAPKKGSQWVFLKEGTEDTTTTTAPLRSGSSLKYEFIFFEEPNRFRAVLVFRQNGQVLTGGTVEVDAPGNELFVTDTVVLQ